MGLPFLNPQVIAEGGQPVQVPDPLAQMAEVARVRQAQQQVALGPLRQQQLQGEVTQRELTNQNTIDDNADQATIQREFHNPDNLSKDESGNLAPDHDKIRNAIAPNVKVRNLQAFDADYLKMQQGATALATSKADVDKLKWENVKNLNQMAGENIAGIIQAPPEQKQAMYTDALATLKKAGADTSQYPPVVPDDNTLTAMAAKVGYLGTIITNADKQAQEEQRKATAKKTAQAEATKATNDMHAEAATAFQGIDNKADYDQAVSDFAAQDDAHKAYSQRYLMMPYSDKAMATINSRALTAEQRSTATTTKQARDEQADRDDETRRHNQSMEAIDSVKASRESKETANSQATQRHQWQSELMKLKEEEENTTKERGNLESAITSSGGGAPSTYVDDKGNTRAMSTASKEEGATVQALTNRMKGAYQFATDKLKRITADKNQLGQELGLGITVPTPVIHASLDADVKRVLGSTTTKAGTLTPVAQPSATPSSQLGEGAVTIQPSSTPTPVQPTTAIRTGQAKPSAPAVLDPTIKTMSGYSVGEVRQKKDNSWVKITGFSKDGKVLTEPSAAPATAAAPNTVQ